MGGVSNTNSKELVISKEVFRTNSEEIVIYFKVTNILLFVLETPNAKKEVHIFLTSKASL